MLTVDRVEVAGLAERVLALGGPVANVVPVLVATDEANIGIDFVGLKTKATSEPNSWLQQGDDLRVLQES